MKLMFLLAKRQLKENRKRTMFTLLGIVLSVAMVVAVSGFVDSARNALYDLFIKTNGNWHVSVQLLTEEEANTVGADPEIESYYIEKQKYGNEESEESDTDFYTLFFRLKAPTKNYAQDAMRIVKSYELSTYKDGQELFLNYNQEILALEGIVANKRIVTTLYSVAAMAMLIIAAASIIVISNAFSISASERIQQFGILKSVGAAKQQILSSIFCEGLIISIVGIPLGVITGLLVQVGVLGITNSLLKDFNDIQRHSGVHFKPSFSIAAILIAIVISFITIMISVWIPASKAAKISAIDAIRETGEIKIRGKKVKTSKLTQKLFGIEGTLAAKSLKRSKRKYRATVVALSVSVALFVFSSGFGALMAGSVEAMYPEYNGNISAAGKRGNFSELMKNNKKIDDIVKEHGSKEDVVYSIGNTDFERKSEFPSGFITDKAVEYLQMGDEPLFTSILIKTVDDASYEEICKQAGVSATEKGAVLLNEMYVMMDSSRIRFSPYNYSPFTVTGKDYSDDETLYDIPVIGEIKSMPERLRFFTVTNSVWLVVSHSNFAEMFGDMKDVYSSWFINAQDPYKLTDLFNKAFEPAGKNAVSFQNIVKLAKAMGDLNKLMLIFVYGFIAMLTCIGVTSVINTISANMKLRSREFATLSSVGMTPEGLKKMLSFESIFYSLKAIFFGVTIGTLLSFALYSTMASFVDTGYILPWQSILISIVGVFLVSLISMRYASKSVFGKSIVERIRRSTV